MEFIASTSYPCLGVVANGYCPYTPSYPARECTSGASWWGSQYQHKPWPTGWGNALYWPAQARAAGFTVSATPVINSIMCIPPNRNGAGSKGHVAFVTSAPVNGQVRVIEMNFLIEFGFDYRQALTANCEYIHLVAPDPPPPSGDSEMALYQLNNGTIYLLSGGTKTLLGTGADATYLMGEGLKLWYESKLTPAAAANIARWPIV